MNVVIEIQKLINGKHYLISLTYLLHICRALLHTLENMNYGFAVNVENTFLLRKSQSTAHIVEAQNSYAMGLLRQSAFRKEH